MIFNKKLSLGLILSVVLSTTGCSIPNLSNSSDPASSIGNNKQIQKSFSSKAVMNQLSEGYNETAYLLSYPDVAAAVADGRLPDGYTHYRFVGRSENRLTNPEYLNAKNAIVYEGFSARAYLNAFSDVSAAYGANNSRAAYNHYITFGRSENRLDDITYINETLKSGFNEEAYLLAFPEVKEAVRMGQYLNGYEHFIIMGRAQGFLSKPAYLGIRVDIVNNGYSEESYLLAFPDVANAVKAGTFTSGYQHYNTLGRNENRLASPEYQAIRQAYVFEDYIEEAYLLAFPDIENAVNSGSIKSGYVHYRNSGKAEGRLDRPVYDRAYKDIIDGYDEDVYILAFPDVAAAVTAGTFRNGYAHYNSLGRNENRLSISAYRLILAGTQFVPIRPMNLTTTNQTQTSLTVNWNKSLGATGYNVYNGNTLLASFESNTVASYNVTGLAAGTTYNISVTAMNVRGESAKSPIAAKTRIGSVTNVTNSNIETSTAQIRFDTTKGATGYRIYNGSTPLFEVNNVDGFISNLGVNLDNLTPGTNYTLTVKAFDSLGETSGSNTSFLTKPATPSVTPSAITVSSFMISWAPVQGTSVPVANATYNVYLGTGNTAPAIVSANQTATSYTFNTGITASTTYNVQVGAVNATGESIRANLSVTTVPTNPMNLVATNVGQTTATLNWNPVTGATSYNVYNGNTFVSSVTSPTINLTNLTPGTTYTYNVSAVNSGGESTKTPVTFTTAPGAPTGLNTTNITNSSITLNWTATPGATNYKVFIVDLITGQDTLVNSNVTATSYTYTGLMQNTSYTLKVLSSDGTTDSGKSSITASTLSINFGGGIGRN